jgi:2,4-dienoyl-CoA reductase-like NADH-dependent reductase (Old Yellow Enzyme family)
MPRELTVEEIHDIVKDLCSGRAPARRPGSTAVEIPAGNGY